MSGVLKIEIKESWEGEVVNPEERLRELKLVPA